MSLGPCLLHAVDCLEKQPDKRLVVIAILVAIIVPTVLLIAQVIFRVQVWRSIVEGLKWLAKLRIVHAGDRIPNPAAPPQTVPRREAYEPQWYVDTDGSQSGNPTDITVKPYGQIYRFAVPIVVTYVGLGAPSEAFTLTVHTRLPFQITQYLDEHDAIGGQSRHSPLTREGEVWQMVEFRQLSAMHYGQHKKMGTLIFATVSNVPLPRAFDVTWRVQYGGALFPPSSYGTFTINVLPPQEVDETNQPR
jgi:hypothetical protein